MSPTPCVSTTMPTPFLNYTTTLLPNVAHTLSYDAIPGSFGSPPYSASVYALCNLNDEEIECGKFLMTPQPLEWNGLNGGRWSQSLAHNHSHPMNLTVSFFCQEPEGLARLGLVSWYIDKVSVSANDGERTVSFTKSILAVLSIGLLLCSF